MALDLRRAGPTLIAAVLALVYVIVSPPSLDLAAHLLRAKLFSTQGFGIWNNWWYAGHHILGYSVLFPAVSAALTPQAAAAIASTATAAVFEMLVRRRYGPDAWVGAMWFGAATATDLYTGRLAFAFGLLPAMATALALQRERRGLAWLLAAVTALCSPVAALFAALAGASYAIACLIGPRRGLRDVWTGAGVVLAALAPVGVLAVAFPEGGTEPFTFATLWPLPLICLVGAIFVPSRDQALRVGLILYGLGCIAAYEVPTAVGSNAARLGPLLAGPIAALLWWQRRRLWLLAVVVPLLYLQWQAPVRDVRTSAGDPSGSPAYWRPLLSFLSRQQGQPFRVEIPFTQFHWEAYEVAPRFPLARGWERQLDIKYNHLFYGGALNAASYDAWLHQLAIRFVAVSDARLDYSSHRETRLIDGGLPYLRLVMHSHHWRVYAVADPSSIVEGPMTLQAIGPSSLTIVARRPGTAFVRVRFSPYWALPRGFGCVAPDGSFTKLEVRRSGPLALVMRFSLTRIGAHSPRCS
jgi:hypothetical protein